MFSHRKEFAVEIVIGLVSALAVFKLCFNPAATKPVQILAGLIAIGFSQYTTRTLFHVKHGHQSGG